MPDSNTPATPDEIRQARENAGLLFKHIRKKILKLSARQVGEEKGCGSDAIYHIEDGQHWSKPRALQLADYYGCLLKARNDEDGMAKIAELEKLLPTANTFIPTHINPVSKPTAFGERIRQMRMAQGISADTLGVTSGIAPGVKPQSVASRVHTIERQDHIPHPQVFKLVETLHPGPELTDLLLKGCPDIEERHHGAFMETGGHLIFDEKWVDEQIEKHTMDDELFGRYLTACRESLGLNIKEFAAEADFDRKSIGDWEAGRRCPSPTSAEALCNKFIVEADARAKRLRENDPDSKEPIVLFKRDRFNQLLGISQEAIAKRDAGVAVDIIPLAMEEPHTFTIPLPHHSGREAG